MTFQEFVAAAEAVNPSDTIAVEVKHWRHYRPNDASYTELTFQVYSDTIRAPFKAATPELAVARYREAAHPPVPAEQLAQVGEISPRSVFSDEDLADYARANLRTRVSDVGIGRYEFHGTPGTDRQMVLEVLDDLLEVDVSGYFREDVSEGTTVTLEAPDDGSLTTRVKLMLRGFRVGDGSRMLAQYVVTEED